MKMKCLFSRFARGVASITGHPATFLLAMLGVVIWALMGPFVHFSEIWQLWINTSTTILTFLMVFLLQHSQNHDSRAVQIKLDELLRSIEGARNELIDLENLSEEELTRYCEEFKDLHLKYAQVLQKRGKNVTLTAETVSMPASEN
jgi:low affinity Fe/Cu permease